MMKRTTRLLIIVTVTLMLTGLFAILSVNAVSVSSATGKINAEPFANIRKSASLSAAIVTTADDNAKVTINKEVFTKKGSTSKKDKWYYITYKEKNGYVRADLVDSIKYTTTKGKTTDSVNYRTGPATSFTSKGSLKKKASISVVLKANLKGSSTVWYKIKKGSKYYYVIKKYTKLTESSSSTNTTSSKTTVSISDETLPKNVGQGCSFVLKGIVTSNKKIDSVHFGIKKSKTAIAWVTDVSKTVNDTTFDIANIDKNIAFGKLSAGTYYYVGYVYINSKRYDVVCQKFTIVKLKGPDLLSKVAVNLAWPKGTDSSIYKANPTTSYWDAASLLGYSKSGLDDCSRFMRTVIVHSGYDTAANVPKNIWDQWDYFAASDKWSKVPTTGDNYCEETDLANGDILVYHKKDSSAQAGWHITMYVKLDGAGCLAEASSTQNNFGFINTSYSKIFKKDYYDKYAVYRAAK